MRDKRSYLDSVNAGRRRRVGTSLDEIEMTLDRLESRLGHDAFGDLPSRQPAPERHRDSFRDEREYERDHRAAPRGQERPAHPASAYDDAPRSSLTAEMETLREELRSQMASQVGTELRREFAALKGEIERATRAEAPARQAAGLGAEFERLSAMIQRAANSGDDRQIQLLHREMEGVKKVLGELAREETLRSVDRRFNDMASTVAGTLAGSRNGVDPAIKALAARIEEIGGAVRTLPTSGTLRSLEDKMRVLQGAVERFTHENQRPDTAPDTARNTAMFDAIGERLDEISRAIAASHAPRAAAFDPEPFERIEARISALARQMDEASHEGASYGGAVRDLGDQLAALSRRVEDLAHRVDLPERAIERLAGQIGAIADRLDHAPALPNLDAVFHGLENRLASISGLLEQRHDDALAQGRALFHELEARIDEVAARFAGERQAAAADDDQFIAALDARFAELAARFERQAASRQDDDSAIRDLEERLDTVSRRIEASVGASAIDPHLIRSLESQIAGLADHISRPAPEHDSQFDLTPRLDKIEQSIAASRGDVVEAARRAAEDAVRNFSGGAAESALVAGLADDLKALESLTRRSDDRNARTFEAIHDTLLKVVDRLGAVEAVGMAASAQRDAVRDPVRDIPRDMALGAARTPPLAPEVEAMPLAQALESTVAMPAGEDVVPGAPGRGSLLGGLARKLSTRKDRPAERTTAAAGNVAAGADAAPAVDADTPLDPHLANMPLEPGSGAPDLNSIMRRVRDERTPPAHGAGGDASRADFIAAARRAAQAAAIEAETRKRSPAARGQGGKGGKAGDAKSSALGTLLKSRRKPLLMGIAAVLIALAGLQGGRMLLGGGSDVARAPAPENQIADIEVPAPQVRVAGEEAQPAPQIATAPQVAAEPEIAGEADDDWLDLETTTAAAPAREEIAGAGPVFSAAPAARAEAASAAQIETAPAQDEVVAAIPLEAGPVALREAAAGGDPKALFEIGNRYAEGRGVREDAAGAAKWYEQAAQAGLAPAQYRLGSFYEKGVGVERDVAAAKHWYEQAAQAGNASAMHNLAVLHAMSAENARDNEVAARWFMRAAELGVRDSQFNLGILSAKGVGVTQNLQEAYKWFALVARAGDKDAADKRDEVARALRPEQLETARAAAELWRAKTLDPEANTVEIPESWGESQETTASIGGEAADMRAAIRNIQTILNKNGYNAGSADGLMGERTKTAIAAFQSDNGMKATGEVDETLVRALLDRR
jgi:localization factor PodJL